MCQSTDRWHIQSMEGHVIILGHMFGHMTSKVWRDHMICHVVGQVIASQDHVPPSLGYMGESLSSLSGYSLALGPDWVDLGFSCVIPS